MKNIAFYGCGNISQAIVHGLINSGFNSKNIFFLDRNIKNQNKLRKYKIRNLKNNMNAKIDLFILAVKPKDAIQAYKQILKDFKNPKVVSLVAGIKSKKYTSLDSNIEFLRAMPNTSSRFNLGITALLNATFKKTNFSKVATLFKKIGSVISLDKESHMDIFTGTVGSGPAYFFYLLKAYEKKLMKICNDDKKIVNEIIVNLVKGVGVSFENNSDLDNLISAVKSKKGTTEAGLNSFKSDKLNSYFEKGINSAIKRSKEISNEY